MPVQDYTKWHLPEGAKLRLGKGYINDITYSPDSSRLAVASSIGIWIYDAETGEELDLFTGHTGPVERLAYSPDGRFIVSSSAGKNVRLWDANTGEHKTILTEHTGIGEILAYSPDSSTIAVKDYEEMQLWDVENAARFMYSPDGATIATGDDRFSDGTVRLWDVATGEHKATLTEHVSVGGILAYSPDGATIATGGYEAVKLWDASTGEHKATLAHTHCIQGFTYSPNGTTIATGSCKEVKVDDDIPIETILVTEEVFLWDTNTGEHKVTLTHGGDHISSFVYSPDGSTIATGSCEEIRLWDTDTGKHKTTLMEHTGSTKIAYSPDGSTIINRDSELNVWLWDANTGEYKAKYTCTEGVMSFICNSNGSTIAFESDNFRHLWDAVSREHKATLNLARCILQNAVYNADGSIYASISAGSRDDTYNVGLYDSVTRECKVTLTCAGSAKEFVYSPDGSTIITESSRYEGDFSCEDYYVEYDEFSCVDYVELWDANTGKRKNTLNEWCSQLESFVYSLDSRILAGIGPEGAHLWDTLTGRYITTLPGHAVNSICFSPDSKTVASAGIDGTVLLWEVPASFHKDPGINPQEIHGNWRAGWALDVHTVSSRPLPGGRYDTERTKFGELVFQLKYRDDRTKIQPIAEIAAKFVEEKFAVDGHLVLPYLAAIIPIPPSDINRNFQPVTEITQEIGKLLSVPVRTDYLMKTKQTVPLKNLPDVESKQEQLRGAFAVQSQDLKNRCVLLVDDLYDSGTTLTEATRVLYEQGDVQHVLVLTLTRTRTGRD